MSCEQKTKMSTDHEHTHHFLMISLQLASVWRASAELEGKLSSAPPLPRRAPALDTEWTLTKGAIS